MTSTERHEARYQRRKARRAEKLAQRNRDVGGLEEVFRFNSLFECGLDCCKGVMWKNSAQRFKMHLLSGTAKRRRAVLSGTWKQKPYNHFTLVERGKVRPIDAPHIEDRQIHKVLTRRVLLPLYTPGMIYDNGASMPGKGFDFSKRRLKKHLVEHYRRYGRAGGIFLMDFKGYFPNAPHAAIKARHERYIYDPDLRAMLDYILTVPPHTEKGMPLGVEPSQTEMIALPSPVDNFVKCQLSIRAAAHYMDDYYIIMPDIEALREVAEAVIQRAEAMGIAVNREKSRVVPLDKPFRFCKARYKLTETGAVKVKGSRDSGPRSYRKLRALLAKHQAGQIDRRAVDDYYQSQIAYFEKYDDHTRKLRLMRIYRDYFKER